MNDKVDLKKHYEWGLAALGALLSAPPAIALIQSGFDVHLNWGFAHFVDFYRRVFTPLIDVAQWPFRVALQALDIDWTIPSWLKDLHALSFILASVFVRGWVSRIERNRLHHDANREQYSFEDDETYLKRTRGARIGLLGHPLKQAALIFLLGFSFLGLIAWTWSLISLGFSVGGVAERLITDTRRASKDDHVQRRYKKSLRDDWKGVTGTLLMILDLILLVGATAVVIAVFYVSNALAPQVGF